MFSLVDKRAGFSNPEFVGSNPGSVKKNPFFYKYIESVLGSNIAPSPPPTHFLIFLILYTIPFCRLYNTFYSWFTSPIPNITPYPQLCYQPTPSLSTNPHTSTPQSRPVLTPRLFFFFIISTITSINSSFTSTLTPPPHQPDSHPPPSPLIFFLIFTKTSILRSHPP